ncbi:NAD(+) diphosphatase [Thermoleophilia bacterium SCSIO 60948]|nr:NAD(+) diphosphatase [Thermoleophilia bacterium SCSIO 60948]
MSLDPNAFAGADLDRATALRGDAEALAAARGSADARLLVTSRGDVATRSDGSLDLRELGPDPAPVEVLVGLRDGAALFAAEDHDAIGEERRGLRDLAAALPGAEAAIAATAVAAGNWHRRNGHCSNCGTLTEPGDAGWVRRCPGCGAQHHPRLDPVVIMLVVDDERDRVLLGRQPSWPEGRYSALAGFVEPGESLEEAVIREVAEESGVEVGTVVYRSSQPWPFPGQLMLGFRCLRIAGEAAPVDGELEDARWFARDELSDLVLPPRLAIARRLIDEWLAETSR